MRNRQAKRVCFSLAVRELPTMPSKPAKEKNPKISRDGAGHLFFSATAALMIAIFPGVDAGPVYVDLTM